MRYNFARLNLKQCLANKLKIVVNICWFKESYQFAKNFYKNSLKTY